MSCVRRKEEEGKEEDDDDDHDEGDDEEDEEKTLQHMAREVVSTRCASMDPRATLSGIRGPSLPARLLASAGGAMVLCWPEEVHREEKGGGGGGEGAGGGGGLCHSLRGVLSWSLVAGVGSDMFRGTRSDELLQ